jgi:CheY-like chemotaxis protein
VPRHANEPRQSGTIYTVRPLSGLRVLVVDDEPEAREVLHALLQLEGAEVVAVESAAAALEKIRTWHPTVLISDVGMPVQDGYNLMKHVRRLPEEQGGRVPAIALTAYASIDDTRRARDAGFHVHLPKPVDPPRLVAAIASLAGITEH